MFTFDGRLRYHGSAGVLVRRDGRWIGDGARRVPGAPGTVLRDLADRAEQGQAEDVELADAEAVYVEAYSRAHGRSPASRPHILRHLTPHRGRQSYPELMAAVVAMTAAGESILTIAERLGISSRHVSRLRSRARRVP